MSEIIIDYVDANAFQDFVKKLLAIDRFIFMKMDKDSVYSSVYLPQKDAVKFVKVEIGDIFELSSPLNKTIKVSFYNGTRIVEALSQFTTDNIKGKIIYDEVGDECIASDFIIYDDTLEIKLFCSDPSLNFMDMSDDEMNRAFGTDSSLFNFDMMTEYVDKMSSLFKLDKEHDTFVLEVGYNNKDGIFIHGDNYNSILTDTYKGNRGEKVTIYKKYLPLLDKENYEAAVCDNKIVFKSKDTDTTLTIAVCMTDDDDDE